MYKRQEQTLTEWERHARAEQDAKLPSWCPRWCTTDHRKILEDEGAQEAQTHYRGGGEGTLGEIRNAISGVVERQSARAAAAGT